MRGRAATVELAGLLIAPVLVTVAGIGLVRLAAGCGGGGMRGRAATVEPAGLLIAPVLVTVARADLVGLRPVAAVAG